MGQGKQYIRTDRQREREREREQRTKILGIDYGNGLLFACLRWECPIPYESGSQVHKTG
jgi:hypothetical protein